MSYLHMTTRDECDHRERYALGSEYDREFKVLLRLIRSTFLGKVKDHCCRSVFFFKHFLDEMGKSRNVLAPPCCSQWSS